MNFHAWWQSLELEKNGIDERELKRRYFSRRAVQFDVKEGEKIYSPETCLLVPPEVLRFMRLKNRNSEQGLQKLEKIINKYDSTNISILISSLFLLKC